MAAVIRNWPSVKVQWRLFGDDPGTRRDVHFASMDDAHLFVTAIGALDVVITDTRGRKS